MWFEDWTSPLSVDIPVKDPAAFLQQLSVIPVQGGTPVYVDKLRTGFLVWAPTVKAYKPVDSEATQLQWQPESSAALQTMREVLMTDKFFDQLAQLLGQESNKNPSRLTLRAENVIFVKSLGS